MTGTPIMDHQLTQLARAVGGRLRRRGLTIATAESCTGGLLGHAITEIAGSSEYYLGGVVAYSNALKLSLLGVSEATLARDGAVSRQTALEMARGARDRLGADVGIGTTGIAGPGGATPGKPVGLVCVAITAPNDTIVHSWHFAGDRSAIKEQTAVAALGALLSIVGEME